MVLLSFNSLNVSIAGHGSSIIRVEGGLSAHILWPCRLPWPRNLISDVDIDIFVDDGLPAVRCKRLVGYLGRRALLEDIITTRRRTAFESIVLKKTLSFCNTSRLPCAAAVEVLMDVDVAATSWKAVVFLVAEVIVLAIAAGGTPATSPHALESVAIPALASARLFVIIAGKITGRRAIHSRFLRKRSADPTSLIW